MEVEVALTRGKELLNQKDFAGAVREFKKASRLSANNPEIYFLLSQAYLRMESRPYFLLAEDAIRTALKFDSFNMTYNDLLLSVKTKLGMLDELCTEYKDKHKKKPNPLYEQMLKKISTISILSIPSTGGKKLKQRAKGVFFLNYVVMPLIVGGVLIVWLDPKYVAFRFLSLLIVIAYFVFRVTSKPKSRLKNDWGRIK